MNPLNKKNLFHVFVFGGLLVNAVVIALILIYYVF